MQSSKSLVVSNELCELVAMVLTLGSNSPLICTARLSADKYQESKKDEKQIRVHVGSANSRQRSTKLNLKETVKVSLFLFMGFARDETSSPFGQSSECLSRRLCSVMLPLTCIVFPVDDGIAIGHQLFSLE